MCLPAGARVGSKRLGCTSRTKGRSRCSPVDGRLLRGGDLVERAAEVHRARARDLRRAPGDRAVERPVELEDARPVAVAREPPGVAGRAAGRRPASASWRGVTSSSVAPAPASSSSDSTHLPVSISPPRERRCDGERVGQALRAAARHRPADPMGAQREHDPEGGAGRRAQREHRVRAAAGEQRARPLALEARARQPGRRAERAQRRSAPAPADGAAGEAGRGSRA